MGRERKKSVSGVRERGVSRARERGDESGTGECERCERFGLVRERGESGERENWAREG